MPQDEFFHTAVFYHKFLHLRSQFIHKLCVRVYISFNIQIIQRISQ